MDASSGLSPAIIFAVVGLVVVQLGLQVFAILDIVKRDKGRWPTKKVVWLIVILFGEILGALIYLVWGRTTFGVAAGPEAVAASADTAASAVDALYGEPKDGGQE